MADGEHLMPRSRPNYLLSLTREEYLVHQDWMAQAIALAKEAGDGGDIPVGAIVVDAQGHAIAKANNLKQRNQDPTAHAEIIALRAASQVKQNWHLNDCTLYVTLEPCPMCAGAIVQSRIGLLVYGVDDPKTGAIRTVMNIPDSAASNHRLLVLAGVAEVECRQMLQSWFAHRRKSRTSKIHNSGNY
ncbi:cytosine/adenosine deaminase [Xenococcus sp. PCC 7305]|nr:cytosine/adenosine deaminase [Xenococcus sp. PCC 7305]